MKRVFNPFRLMHEPPAITALITAIYSCFALAGLALIAIPTDLAIGIYGDTVLRLIGAATLLGGTAGAVAVWPGFWWLERAGIAGCSVAIFTYMVSLGITGGWDGGTIFREFMVLIIILFLAIRILWISSLDLDPTKPPYRSEI